jgi:hypothetical protein
MKHPLCMIALAILTRFCSCPLPTITFTAGHGIHIGLKYGKESYSSSYKDNTRFIAHLSLFVLVLRTINVTKASLSVSSDFRANIH